MTGLACGKGLHVASAHPDTAKTLLSYTAVSAVVGATFGVGVAYYRKAPLHVYGLSAGANFALCSFAFFGEFISVTHYNANHRKALDNAHLLLEN